MADVVPIRAEDFAQEPLFVFKGFPVERLGITITGNKVFDRTQQLDPEQMLSVRLTVQVKGFNTRRIGSDNGMAAKYAEVAECEVIALEIEE